MPLYQPPTFPDLLHDVPITGITYLHGRLPDRDGTSHDYVLSSADFGGAYLAQGWATSFVRLLLNKYTVVLLGYQAEDPPAKYLLQGLNAVQGEGRRQLYAFDQGQPEEIETKWQDRGVTPIAYGDDHRVLWDSLEGWAARSADTGAWRVQVWHGVESGAGAPALGFGGTTPLRGSRHFRSGPQSGSHGRVSRPLLINPDVRISRIRLSDEIMNSPTEGRVSSSQGR